MAVEASGSETVAVKPGSAELTEDMMISTRFTERFGIKHPIVCAPMAFVTGGALAAAVCRAGGLGIVGGGYAGTLGGEPDLETELSRAKSGKFGVGFITWALARAPKMLTKALQHSPFCVFLSFGDPRPFAAEIRDAGAALICQVQFLSQIDVALEAGAAAIVVQGTEAGGHGGNRNVSVCAGSCRLLETTLAQNFADCRRRHSGRERIGSGADAWRRCGGSGNTSVGVGRSAHPKGAH